MLHAWFSPALVGAPRGAHGIPKRELLRRAGAVGRGERGRDSTRRSNGASPIHPTQSQTLAVSQAPSTALNHGRSGNWYSLNWDATGRIC